MKRMIQTYLFGTRQGLEVDSSHQTNARLCEMNGEFYYFTKGPIQ